MPIKKQAKDGIDKEKMRGGKIVCGGAGWGIGSGMRANPRISGA